MKPEFIEEAWSKVKNHEALTKLYESAAKKDEALALALARYHGEAADRHALRGEAIEQLAPLVASGLFTDRARWAWRDVMELGNSRSADLARTMLPKAAGPELRRGLAGVLAVHGTEADLEAVKRALRGTDEDQDDDDTTNLSIWVAMARRGDAQARQQLAAYANGVSEWCRTRAHSSSSAWDRPFAIVDAVASCEVREAVPALLGLLDTPCVVHALEALERFAEPSAREPARQILRENQGDEERSWPYRLAAQGVLHALGEPQGVDDALAVLERLSPRRYGWPKVEHLPRLQRLALRALRLRGGKAGLDRVATWVTAPRSMLREEGALAAKALGKERIVKVIDGPLAHQTLEEDGPAALEKWLKEGVARDFVVATILSEAKNPRARAAAVDWAVEVVEGRHPHLSPFTDPDAVDDTVGAALEILEAVKDEPKQQKRLAALKSPLARKHLFDEEPERPVTPSPRPVTLRRVDQAPFLFGAQLNALTLDPTQTRLAVCLGDAVDRIIDARSGDELVTLEQKFRWGNDASFSPDGTLLAVAYHGCHLVVYDATSGKFLYELPGFGGVPNGLRCVAFSPDGRYLAGGGNSGQAAIFEVKSRKQVWKASKPGSFERVLFSSDSASCIFSHVNVKRGEKNELHVVAMKTRKAKVVPMPSSMWAMALDEQGSLWVGGEAKQILQLDAKFKPARGVKLAQGKVTRLAFTSDGRLAATSATGQLNVWDVAKRKATQVVKSAKDESTALWALACGKGGVVFSGGKGAKVLRHDAAGALIPGLPGAVHTGQPRGFAFLPDGTMVSAAWDGRLLAWKPGAPTGAVLAETGSRLTGVTLSTDGMRVYAGGSNTLLVHELKTGENSSIALKDRVEDLAVRAGRLVVGLDDGQVLMFDEQKLSAPVWAATAGKGVASVAFTETGTVLVGNDNGGLVELSADGKQLWSKREHGWDLIDKDPLGSPHRDVVGLDVHGDRFASLSNDDTLRVFSVSTKQRQLRLMVDGGLFNSCAFSPSGTFVAASSSAEVQVFDATSGALRWAARHPQFGAAGGRTVLAFGDERTLVIGTEGGALYEATLEG